MEKVKPVRVAEEVERPPPVREFKSGPCRFELWLSQTNDFKIDTYRFLARHWGSNPSHGYNI